MKRRKSRDPLAIDITRDLEKRGVHIDVESIEATVAKFRAAEEDKLYALIDSFITLIEHLVEAWQATAFDPAAVQRTRRMAAIRREHAKLTDQLRRSGELKAAAQAWEDLAKRYRTSVGALSRSVRARNR
jgi:hypothetical protein